MLAGAVLVVALAALTACQGSEGDVDSDLTVEQAKADTQRFELEVAEAVPADIVDRIEQLETGSLLRCGPDQQFSWSGSTRVYLTVQPTDERQFMEDIAAALDDSEFLLDGDRPITEARGPEGQSVIMSLRDDGYVNINSGSACFILPEDADPLGDY
ncbi:hypothetical protein HDC37_000956 [Microbacterium sp. AK009]|uniref:hypothetical protein n=1 Tax=Microbacterium sp. AK009 TaxID=2723068 RepID=UPI0015CC2977|nr:hypothetical protein [Microbacterium sp. AK009]NYF16142.1 hypothetical protein [Microbacterium sp. AK009]